LAAIAVCQAAIGLLQAFGPLSSGGANGSYTNRDHFAGFLEMVLPITAICGLSILRHPKTRSELSALPALAACAWWAISALLLLAIVYSFSRMGFLVALSALFFVAVLGLGPQFPSRMWRRSAFALIGAIVLLAPLIITPTQLIERFAAISSTEKVSADTRVLLWEETLPLISEFRLFGTGLGGFESSFLKYQATANSYRVEFAHNDYLQYIAELGFVGAALLAAIAIGIVAQILNGILKLVDEDRRLVVVGCAGSLLAMLMHSLVDFNTRIPANAMTLVWIAAVASTNASTAFPAITPQPASRKHPVSLRDQGRKRKGRGCTPPDNEGTRWLFGRRA
jgi:O-antigen ligase